MPQSLIIVPPRYPVSWIKDAADKGMLGDGDNTILLLASNCFLEGGGDVGPARIPARAFMFQQWRGRRMDKLKYLVWTWRHSFGGHRMTLMQYMDADRGLRSSLEALFALMLFRGRVRVLHPVPCDNEWLCRGGVPIKWSIHELSLSNFPHYVLRMCLYRLPNGWTLLYWCLFGALLVRSIVTRPKTGAASWSNRLKSK
ncbi:MAG: hypothetical protein ACLQPD_27205 [Desulfomonilaceae bacterium]